MASHRFVVDDEYFPKIFCKLVEKQGSSCIRVRQPCDNSEKAYSVFLTFGKDSTIQQSVPPTQTSLVAMCWLDSSPMPKSFRLSVMFEFLNDFFDRLQKFVRWIDKTNAYPIGLLMNHGRLTTQYS